MKTLLLSTLLFSLSSFGQIEKPLLDGHCEGHDIKMMNGEVTVKIPKDKKARSCVFKVANASTSPRTKKITFYLTPQFCNGVSVDKSDKEIVDRGFLTITAEGETGASAILFIKKEKSPLVCQLTANMKKLDQFASERENR